MTQTVRLYGSSMYELAAGENLSDIILTQMQMIRDIFRKNPEYVKLLMEPSLPKTIRTALIEEAFGTGAERYLVNFLKLLCEKNLLTEYAECCKEYTRLYNADHNIADAVVTCAVPLDGEQLAALKERLETISGKQISLSVRRDPSVIAGLRVELEGKQLDGTVQGRLSSVSRKLNEIIV